MDFLQPQPEGLRLVVYVQPKSSRNRIAGIHGHALKVCVTAPPVEGEANKAVINFFAKLFQLPKSGVSIQTGMQGRNKTIFLSGISLEKASALITQHLPS